MIYGKTIISMSNDIHNHFSKLLGKKECTSLAIRINKFFEGIINLMNLIRNVGWFSAALKKPVFYSIPLLTSVQDYMKTKPINIWIYDRIHKKRRKVTLRIATEDRDRRKTLMATFANFIHQKDAYIAMYMIIEMISRGIPVYTVHDNLITTAPYAMKASNFYISTISGGRDSLLFINFFITRNLLEGRTSTYSLDRPIPLDYLERIL